MADPIIAFKGTAPGPDEPGKFHQGLPARSLSGAEYDALDTDQRALVRASALYDYAAYRDALKQRRDAAEVPAPEAPVTAAPAPDAAEIPAPEAEFAVPAPDAEVAAPSPEEPTTEPAAPEAGADAPPPAEAGA